MSCTLSRYFSLGQSPAIHLNPRSRFVLTFECGKTRSRPGCYSAPWKICCSVVLTLGPTPNTSTAALAAGSDTSKHSSGSVQLQSAAHFSNKTTTFGLSRIGPRRIRLGIVFCFDHFPILSVPKVFSPFWCWLLNGLVFFLVKNPLVGK